MSERDIDVLVAVNYYTPYVSGLTNAARFVAEDLVARGYRVTVVASQHDRALPQRDIINGVEVIRTPVVASIGKGLVSPGFGGTVAELARRARLLHLHLPMIEAGLIAHLVKETGILSTYHCDLEVFRPLMGTLQQAAMDASCRVAIRRSDAVVVTSMDYARSSRLRETLSRITPRVIPPPTRDRGIGTPTFRSGPGLHFGFLGRISEEKGLSYLLEGFSRLADPAARLLIGGAADVSTGRVLARLRERIAADPRVAVLGFVPEAELADFYASLDAFVLPSVSSLEAFGIVQIDAMRAGVPVIATDLPGVRVPVRKTGYGVIVPPRDAQAISNAMVELAARLPLPRAGRDRARALYSPRTTTDAYVEALVRGSRGRFVARP